MLLPLESSTVLKTVDTDIFAMRYFGHCMQCTFCMDSCCQYGCDVNLDERDRILALAGELQPFVAPPKERWFSTEVKADPDYPSGHYVRSQVEGGACVFLSQQGRGCGLHRFALATGRDYHRVKPLVCWLFPLTWDLGLLRPSYDMTDDLACKGEGPIIYDLAREELQVVFGAGLVEELDRLRLTLPGGAAARPPARPGSAPPPR
jgi:Fe-S-cluster containining protein